MANTNLSNIDNLIKRMYIFLNESDWKRADEYCEKVLDVDLENGTAYLGKLLVDLKFKNMQMFKFSQTDDYEDNKNYQYFLKYANEDLKNEFFQIIQERDEELVALEKRRKKRRQQIKQQHKEFLKSKESEYLQLLNELLKKQSIIKLNDNYSIEELEKVVIEALEITKSKNKKNYKFWKNIVEYIGTLIIIKNPHHYSLTKEGNFDYNSIIIIYIYNYLNEYHHYIRCKDLDYLKNLITNEKCSFYSFENYKSNKLGSMSYEVDFFDLIFYFKSNRKLAKDTAKKDFQLLKNYWQKTAEAVFFSTIEDFKKMVRENISNISKTYFYFTDEKKHEIKNKIFNSLYDPNILILDETCWIFKYNMCLKIKFHEWGLLNYRIEYYIFSQYDVIEKSDNEWIIDYYIVLDKTYEYFDITLYKMQDKIRKSNEFLLGSEVNNYINTHQVEKFYEWDFNDYLIEQKEIEKNKKIQKYWEEHSDEKEKLLNKKKSLSQKIIELQDEMKNNNEIIQKLNDEKLFFKDDNEEIIKINNTIKELELEKKNTIIFNQKKRKELQTSIDKFSQDLKKEQEKQDRINKDKQDEINSRLEDIKAKNSSINNELKVVNEKINKIDNELQKER